MDELLPPGVQVEIEPIFDVAGHPVQFDEERKLWFCDIQIAGLQSYCPFVRLALARYQPNSIHLAELSHVVLTDFFQLLPDRTVTLTHNPYNPNIINITVAGLTYLSTSWKHMIMTPTRRPGCK